MEHHSPSSMIDHKTLDEGSEEDFMHFCEYAQV